MSFTAKIEAYIRKHEMIAPGDRVGVAVSGGADSVALLRALVELRGELGCVLALAHFNHKIRPEADAEAGFVEGLARGFGLEFYVSCGDAKKSAAQKRVSLETAARMLRYEFFSQLPFDKIATAHTLDDQAETVLMKLLRGAGTKGLSGIWPTRQHPVPSTRCPEKRVPRFAGDDNPNQTQGPSIRAKDGRSLGMTRDIGKWSLGMTVNGDTQSGAGEGAHAHTTFLIRPMLGIRRQEVEAYLRSLGQDWREDGSNRDVKHTRNKLRHELLPLLEAEYNPNIYRQLADAAEVARAEEEYWTEVVRTQEAEGRGLEKRQSEKQHSAFSAQHSEKQVPRGARDDNSFDLQSMLEQPLALRRRAVRAVFARVSGKALDFEHTDALVRFLERRESSLLQLPERWFAKLDWPRRTLSFEERDPVPKAGTGNGQSSSKAMSKKSGELAERKV